jgi:hypothetical protein
MEREHRHVTPRQRVAPSRPHQTRFLHALTFIFITTLLNLSYFIISSEHVLCAHTECPHVEPLVHLLPTRLCVMATPSRSKSLEVVWEKVYAAVAAPTPPPCPASSIQQTPWLRSTGNSANSTEHRKDIDNVLKEELGYIYVGVPNFFNAFFREVVDLRPAIQAVFNKYKEGDTPLY